jgi:hypothetical protein
MSPRLLNVLQVCDHLGWEGSRMHGVKRLFSWMIPRFDPDRFRVSLVSLRKKDLSEETLEAQGVDITYLHRSKFDPLTLRDLLRVIDRQQIDVLHLHGLRRDDIRADGRGAAWSATILHEHANLTDTPWFQKVADYLLEPCTDIAIAVSKSTADFVIHARLVPASKVKVVYLGVPLEEFSRSRSADEIAARTARARRPAGRLRDRHGHAAARLERQLLPRRRGGPRHPRTPARQVFPRRRRTVAAGAGVAGGRPRSRRSFRVRRIPARRRGGAVGVRPERVSLLVGRHADHRFRGARDGEADRRHRRGRPPRHPDPRARRVDSCRSAMPARWRRKSCGRSITRTSGPTSAPPPAPPDVSTTLRRSCGRWSGSTRFLHDTSRATRRKGVLNADLSFLTSESSA